MFSNDCGGDFTMESETRIEKEKGDILVVDDTPVNLRLLSEMLRKQGYSVREANDGVTALQRVQAKQPDLILLDIRLPNIDGYDVCQRLKANEGTRDIPVIFISVLQDVDDIVKAFEVGGVDYITKPFKFREIYVRVENQLTLARQRKQIQAIHEKDRQYLETLNHLKDQFIRAATHDLKSPLALIVGYAGLLESHEPVANDPSVQDYVQGIRRGTNKLKMLVTDMLDLLEMESGVELTLTSMSLTDFLQSTVKNFEVQAKQKQIDLIFTAPLEDVYVTADISRLERAMNNLLSNAIKYTPEHNQIEVAAQIGSEHIALQVIDTGYGIPEEDIPHLFEAFHRVRQKEHLAQEGTGLGLSIVRSIVEQHGGEVRVESELGRGSTFSIVLPLQISTQRHPA